MSGPHVELARRFRDGVAEAWGKPLTMNVSMPIAAVMLDLGFPSATVKAVPILARTAGLLAHLAEEQQQPLGFLMAGARGGGDRVRAPTGGRAQLILAPEVETRPWEEQLAVDDASYSDPARLPLRALGLLSRQARGGRVHLVGRAAGGLAQIARLPLTEKRELRDTCTPDNPIGAHLCAAPAEIVRIYSTSGTTGSAELHPADGGRPRQLGDRLGAQLRGVRRRGRPARGHHLQRRAVRGGRGAGLVRSHRARPTSRSAPGTPSGCCAPSSCSGPRPPCSRPRTPPTSSSGRPSGASTCAGRASGACSWRASPAAASRPSARRSRRAGARG